MSRNAATALSAVFLAFGVAACSGDEASNESADGGAATATAEEQAAAAELVDWAEAFCAAPEVVPVDLHLPFTASAHNTPTTEEDRQPLLDALADTDQALAEALAAIDDLPLGPTPGAEAAVGQYRADLEETRTALAEYTEIAPVYVPADLEGLFMLAGFDLMNLPYPLMMAETYLTEPDLAEAAESAPACGGEPETSSEGS
ncbi:MAG TPA: hypothetical protein VHG10_11805 [Glycomyces sp.]|nr:hypothetical protein [Glycomyces sp.]